MNLSEFANLLKSLDIPVRYRSFKKGEAPTLPYAVYYQSGENNLYADNISYQYSKIVAVELITEKKNEKLEDKLKSLLNSNRLSYEFFDEVKLESEGLYQVIYHIDLL